MAWIACVFLVPSAAAAQEAASDREAQAAIERFRKAYKGPEDDLAAAVTILGKVRHRKVMEVLAKVIDEPFPSVRIEAASALAAYEKDRDAAQAVSRALASSRKWPPVQIACLDALGGIRDWNSAPVVIKHFKSPELKVVAAALRAAGKIKNPVFVEALIGFLRDTGAGTGRPASWMEHQFNRALMCALAHGSLQQITGEARRRRDGRASEPYRATQGADGWEAWWKEHGAGVTERLRKEESEELERLAPQKTPGPPGRGGRGD